jgi:hypothetical protein
VGDCSVAPRLVRSMQHDEHPVVRLHSAWALGRLARRLDMPELRLSLASAYGSEQDFDVREEIGTLSVNANRSLRAGLASQSLGHCHGCSTPEPVPLRARRTVNSP